MERVLPGNEDVFAIFVLNKEFMNDDFPTFERPQRTTAGRFSFGSSLRL
jgi:hypothetical protein